MEKIHKLFIDKLGMPVSNELLNEYIVFCIENNNLFEDYCEVHHILPRCKFPEYENLKTHAFNKTALSLSNHTKAHELLVAAYPITSFKYACNLMSFATNSDIKSLSARIAAEIMWEKYRSDLELFDDLREKQSKASKKHWESFRNSETYFGWVESRSKWMKEGQAKEMARIFYEEMNGSEFMSNHFKEMWADPEHKASHIQSMIEEKKTPEAKVRMSKASQSVWESYTEEEYQRRCEINRIANTTEAAIQRNRESNKKLWENEEFVLKMKQRNPRGGLSVTVNGITYNTIAEANKLTGISRKKLRKLVYETNKN